MSIMHIILLLAVKPSIGMPQLTYLQRLGIKQWCMGLARSLMEEEMEYIVIEKQKQNSKIKQRKEGKGLREGA